MKRWYVARSNPRQEGGASVFVRSLGYETFLPYVSRRVLIFGRLVPRRELMFPGYLFIWCKMSMNAWAEIVRTPGVRDMLRNVERTYPGTVADELMDAIRLRMTNDQPEPVDDAFSFQKGDPLHITSGPYAGLSALYDSSSDVRITALITLFNRQTRVPLPLDAVERVWA